MSLAPGPVVAPGRAEAGGAAVMPGDDVIGEDDIPGMGALVSALRGYCGQVQAPVPFAGALRPPRRVDRGGVPQRRRPRAESLRATEELFDRMMTEHFSAAAAALPTLAHIPRLCIGRKVVLRAAALTRRSLTTECAPGRGRGQSSEQGTAGRGVGWR